MAQTKLNWTDTDSSNVKRVGYHEHSRTLCVQFNSGGLYSYMEVPNEHFVGLVHAPSIGRYLNDVIKSFPYTKWDDEAELIAHLEHTEAITNRA